MARFAKSVITPAAIVTDERLHRGLVYSEFKHGARYRILKRVPVVPNVQPLRSVQDVSDNG